MEKQYDDDALLDTKAVAVYLGVSRRTVYRAVKAGRIEALGFRVRRIERIYRFERLDIHEDVLAIGGVWECRVGLR